jgi:hypothetical protein
LCGNDTVASYWLKPDRNQQEGCRFATMLSSCTGKKISVYGLNKSGTERLIFLVNATVSEPGEAPQTSGIT